MTIDEAIQTLQGILEDEDSEWEPEGQNSLKLGIEALKMLKRMKEFGVVKEASLLPGETTE